MKTLHAVLSEYRDSLSPGSSDAREILRFREFLLVHGGLRRRVAPGGGEEIIERAASLRCFHFSQYLDWYLAEKEGLSKSEVEEARAAMRRLNEWLLDHGRIGADDFQDNRESIRGGEEGPQVFQEISAGEDGAAPSGDVAEERDFYVPGEYASLLSGEFTLTQVQEGILVGRRDGDPREIGPILVDRTVSAGSRVGDRVHMSLGKAGSHWNLLTIGRRRS